MKTLGICFGATNLQAVILQSSQDVKTVELSIRIPHEGNPKQVFLDFLRSLDLSNIDKIAITGRNFRNNVGLSSIAEAEFCYQQWRRNSISLSNQDPR